MNQENRSVVIQISHSEFGSARSSALQFDNVIIAHGSLLYALSSKNGSIEEMNNILINFQSVIDDLKNQQCFVNPKTFKGKVNRPRSINFNILKECLSEVNSKKINDDSRSVNEVISNENYSSEEATLCFIFKWYGGNDIHEDVFHLVSTNDKKVGLTADRDRGDSYGRLVVPVFLILMTGTPNKYLFEKSTYNLMTLMQDIPIYAGLSIAVESTPFANTSFYNSLSRGIISKLLGPDQEGFLIDARIVPGCEGAPIYVFKDGLKGAVFGIVVSSVSSSEDEWNGFSLGFNLKYLLRATLAGLGQADDFTSFEKTDLNNVPSFLDIDLLSSAVVFVRCQHKWGSGVVVDAASGLILTCSHIVHHAQNSVHVVFKGKKYPAVVEYASPPSDPYDLAVLSVGKIPGLRQLTMAKTSPVAGEPVISVGYPMSSESTVINNGTPTLSSGCVSKVSRCGGPLQTTCCTQAGVSGGAVLRQPDQLIGIVVSNIRIGSNVLPFFSFAVSVDDFRTAVGQFIHTRDSTCLQSLSVKSPEVKMKWMLQDSKL